MYSEFAFDPKIQSMPENMQRRFVMLLCLRSCNVTETLHVTDVTDELSCALRISADELAETKELFVRKGFINDNWEVLNWEKRQYISDSSAARVASHRARKKQAVADEKNVTVTQCNVTVTPPDTETDTETDKNKHTKKPRAITKSIPDRFAISDRVRVWANANGFRNLDAHLENFISCCKAKGYKYVDWDEAFMGAIRKDWANINGVQQSQLFSDKFKGAK
jgi:hypothetical protein